MACELRLLATFDGIEKCRQFLFGEGSYDSSWLLKCVVAVSPLGDRVVLAHGSALAVLTLQWDRGPDSKGCPRLVLSRCHEVMPADDITAATCLPLVAATSHSQNGPDWTCIAVGFASGYLRFYTENMDLVAAERLHPEPLLHVKATGHRKRRQAGPDSEAAEAVHAVYPSVTCSLPGFSLFQTLRGCRSEVAQNLARARSSSIPDVSLDYKKYSLSSQPIRDACVVGYASVNNFDHLMSASLSEGFYGNYRPSPPQHSLVASTGPEAWLRLQHTLEGVAAPLELSDVALTVLSKLPGWLGIGSKKAPASVVRPAEKLAQRCRLLDRRRDGRAVVASPDGALLVVSDSLGRVTLVDVRTGVALRLWKGYRDAECGFLEVEEEVSKVRHRPRHQTTAAATTPPAEAPRRVLLLAIFAPKKGLIELFPLRHGPRVAALRVSRDGRLVHTPHGLLGFSAAPRRSAPGLVPVAFLSEDGLMDLNVPFHCALMDASSRAKDLHVLKQLKARFKEAGGDDMEADVLGFTRQLQTDDVRLLAVDLLSSLNSITPALLCSVLDVFLEAHQDDDPSADPTNSASSVRNVSTLCTQLRNIVQFYSFLYDLPDLAKESCPDDAAPLTEVLLLSELEVSMLVSFLKHTMKVSGSKREARVTFHEESRGHTMPRFLQSLDYAESGRILQKPNMSEEDLRSLGEFMFSKLSPDESAMAVWTQQARLSNISPTVLAASLLAYWLHRPVQHLDNDMRRFVLLLRAVSSFPGAAVAPVENNVESPWQTEMRSAIASSRLTVVALAAAVCCRAVSLQCEQKRELQWAEQGKDNASEQDHGWENVSADTWQWDVLIARLEDVALLNMVLALQPEERRIAAEESEVSLSELLTRGEGAVSELIGQWLSQFSISPQLLVVRSDAEFQAVPIEPEPPRVKGQRVLKHDEGFVLPLVEIAEEVQPGSESEAAILEHLQLLKGRFPYSLTTSALLSNVGWALMGAWQRDLPNVSLLASAIDHLQLIPSAQLKAGVCSLAWSTYLKFHFEGIVRLVGKMGKVPTDVLCTRELDLPRSQIAPFLSNAGRLLAVILDACAERPQPPFPRRREAMLREGKPGLVGVAVARAPPCEEVVLLHHQVTTVIHMVAALELRDKALLSAFIDSLKSDLFGELTARRTVVLYHPGLSKQLTALLRRAVSAAVLTIREVESPGAGGGDGAAGGTCLHSETASAWLRVCCDLGSVWRLRLDLRRHYICELYSCGYDRLAEEALPAVSDTSLLASQLLVVAGQRVKALLAASSEPQEIIAGLSPTLTSWLDSLDVEGLKKCRASVEDTSMLMTRVLLWLPEDHQDASLATLLAESLPALLPEPGP